MNKNVLIKKSIKKKLMRIAFASVFTLTLFPQSILAETPPVPKPRPKIVHVSPEYIKKLMKDRQIAVSEPTPLPITKDNENITTPTSSEPLEEKSVKENVAIPVDTIHLDENTIKNTTKQEILDILDQKKSNAPKPKKKPLPVDDDQTTISFSLQPKDISLTNDIVTFLKDHTLRLLNENPDMILDINVYAKPIDKEKSSSIRISLARSLEVRKWLIENGVSPARLKLNTNRDQTEIESDDRIDLILHH